MMSIIRLHSRRDTHANIHMEDRSHVLDARRRLALIAATVVSVAATACIPGFTRTSSSWNANVPVPDSFLVRFETSKGAFDVMARKAWAPVGVDRLYALVQSRYFDDGRFYRVVKGWVAQWGLAADPTLTAAWRIRTMADEPVKHSNLRGTVAYARGGPGTRSNQLYINFSNNVKLDTSGTIGFPPIAEVVSGMNVVDSLYNGYGESTPRTGPKEGNSGPGQDSISRVGNAYLKRGWPKLDYIKTARVVQEWRK